MIILISCLCVIMPLLYWYSTRTFKYWEVRGVKHDPPLPGFGNNVDNFFAKKSMSQIADDLYKKYPEERFVGFYRQTIPELLIRDPEVIKRVITTDFTHFYSRSLNGDSDSWDHLEPLRRNLSVVEGDKWRLLRQSTTPAFTTGKLKAMFPLIVERAEKLQERGVALSASGDPIDARDLMARFATDFIGACGFGIEADSLDEEDSEFRKLGEKIFQTGYKEFIAFLLKGLFPGRFTNLKVFGKVEDDFLHIVKEIQKQRSYKPSGRHDFIDLLIEIKNKGRVECESMEIRKPDGTPARAYLEIDDMLMAAQVFLFFAAGFETSSSSTSITLHELAYSPDKQKKVQEEIDRVLAKYDNKLCWDAVKELQYLEWCLKEGLRKLPPFGMLNRTCRRKYTFPDTNVTIDEGTRITVSLQALHNDPKFWVNPEEFRPERFSPEEFDEVKMKFVYLPFGSGPRACIGERLGLMQSLAGLAAILSRFTVEPAPNSVRQPVLDPKANMVQGIAAGLPLMFRDRKKLIIS